jgi:carbon-monoxide dehydrogenase large subunit
VLVVEQKEERSSRFVGLPIKRVEDLRFLTGSAKYVEDLTHPNMHYLAILRSPYPHARIKNIDTEDASRLNGVLSVIKGDDIKKISNPIYQWYTAKGLNVANIYCLAVEKVRYFGDPVAAVVADHAGTARDALDLISVDYELLEPVVTIEDALASDAPLLYEEWGTNVMLRHELHGGNVEGAFKTASKIIEEDISSHRYCAAPIQTRSYSALLELPNITVYSCTQQPHQTRTIIARTLGLSEKLIKVVASDIGGGFGAKQPTYPEEVLVPLLALRLKVPLLYFEQRSENLACMHQAREILHHIKVAVDSNGLVLGIRDQITANLGAYLPTCGPGSVIIAGKTITGAYKIQNFKADILGITTNKAPFGAFRGYGKDSGNFAIERVMDVVADEMKLDPLEVRRRNLIKTSDMPYRTPTGALYDSGNYLNCMSMAAELIGYYELKRTKRELEDGTKLLGVGLSLTVEPTGSHYPGAYMLGYEGATVRIEPSGEVTVIVGSTSMGTAHETMVSQIVADELGLSSVENVSVLEGDTKSCSYGYGSWASRTAVTTGNAVALAARELKSKLFKISSLILNAPFSDLESFDSMIYSKVDHNKKITIREIATIAYAGVPTVLPNEVEPGLECTKFFIPPNIEHVEANHGGRNTYAAYSNSAHAAVVEIDRETGTIKILKYIVVTDCGRAINPLVIKGQVVGGVVQGIGGVIYEENAYNSEGFPLATTFVDYLLPTSMESPNIECTICQSPSPFNPLGVKGVGEGPIEGVPATLASAIEDALGSKVLRLPFSPEKIWDLMRSARVPRTSNL